ncbi:MAG: flavodoxin family protein [Pseudomonadota bacterium]
MNWPKRDGALDLAGKHHLLIVAHSQSGSTQKMADAVLRGATSDFIEDVEVRSLSPLDADVDDVLWAHALILGTPENFGYMSGALKYFFDRIFYPCENRIAGLPCALFIRAGNDGTGALTSVRRILSGLGVREVQDPVLLVGEFDERRLIDCEELGATIAAGLEAGLF